MLKLQTLGILFAMLSAFSQAEAPLNSNNDTNRTPGDMGYVSNVKGEVVTGWNQRLGQPVADLPFVGKMSLSINGVCDGSHSKAIDAHTPMNAQLCTHADPFTYKAIFNVDVTDSFPLHQNIPLQKYPQIFSSTGQEKPLPSVKNAAWYEASNGSLSDGYTLGDWLKAEGKMKFVCDKKQSYYEIEANHLVPGGLYTLWLFFFDQVNLPPPYGTGGLQPDLAFGGSSGNVFVADSDGKFSAKRFINLCPQTWPKHEQYQLLNLHLVLHPEGQVYGTVAEQLLKPPYNGGPGVVAIPQLMFTFPKSIQ